MELEDEPGPGPAAAERTGARGRRGDRASASSRSAPPRQQNRRRRVCIGHRLQRARHCPKGFLPSHVSLRQTHWDATRRLGKPAALTDAAHHQEADGHAKATDSSKGAAARKHICLSVIVGGEGDGWRRAHDVVGSRCGH